MKIQRIVSPLITIIVTIIITLTVISCQESMNVTNKVESNTGSHSIEVLAVKNNGLKEPGIVFIIEVDGKQYIGAVSTRGGMALVPKQ